jgi:hypothetical protein
MAEEYRGRPLSEAEKSRLLQIPAGIGQIFRDFIPASEEHLHPGQGTGGAGMDFVPAGFTSASWAEYQAKKAELAAIENERDAQSVVVSAEGTLGAGAEAGPVRRQTGGDRAAGVSKK